MTITRPRLQVRPHVEETILPTARLNGRIVPIVPLQTINYIDLRRGEPKEISRLRSAAQYPGFFYLDLSDLGSLDMEMMNSIARDYFAQPFETKMRDSPRYRPGRVEILNISHNSATVSRPSIPSTLQRSSQVLKVCAQSADEISTTVLSHLDRTTIPPAPGAFKLISASSNASSSASLGGSELPVNLTIIFPSNDRSGPQSYVTEIQLPGTGLCEDLSWAHVVPKPGCALVGVKAVKHRIPDGLQDQDARIWVEYRV